MMEYITRYMDCSLSSYFDGRYDPYEEHQKISKKEENKNEEET